MNRTTNRISASVCKRLSSYNTPLEKGRDVLVCRDPVLMELEGWYESVLNPEIQAILELYKMSESTQKPVAWARDNGLITSRQAEKLGGDFAPVRFKLSCQFKDFARMSNTRHFVSCLRDSGYRKIYASNPHFAIIYVPDHRGEMVMRITACLMRVDKKPVLFVGRVFGTSQSLGVLAAVNRLIPVYCSNRVLNDFWISKFEIVEFDTNNWGDSYAEFRTGYGYALSSSLESAWQKHFV